MTLQFYPLRFSFEACDEIFFPPGKTGNILRGAFGVIFRKLACVPHCTDARTCSLRAVCAYPRLFEPVAPDGPSGMNDAPRPFVFRAAHLDGRRIPPRARFHYDMNLFELR
ncbi:MAG TPA: hypothetical protein VHN20_08130, partial [Beijerinckiaceae bacterium]|nr:hypothetical protein [Beijerinckiaceae bacterium]